ncbi:MAG: FkbM family methyltransferase [Candidatus Acidiferrales bacterium]
MLEAQVNDAEQHAEFHHFLSLCTPKMYLFDIGAHYGAFSVAAALHGGTALAVDPSPTAVRMIAKQAILNKCDKNIQTIRFAVSDSNGVIGLLSSGVFSHGYFKVAKGRPKSELIQSPSVTVDELVRRFGAPTHIKIDVEGHEAAALRGARAFLAEHSPILFLELHNEMVRSERGDPRAALEEITSLGFKTFSLAGCLLTPDEILSQPIIRLVAKRNVSVARAGAAQT